MSKIPLKDLEEYRSFTAKTRGETLEDRFSTLLQRFRKVVDNSKNDSSNYRVAFMTTHNWALRQLEISNDNLILNKEKVLSGIAIEAWAQLRVQKMSDEPTTKGMFFGKKDALSIIALEISDILGWLDE